MAMTITTPMKLGPMIPSMSMANSSEGNDMRTSVNRMMTLIHGSPRVARAQPHEGPDDEASNT